MTAGARHGSSRETGQHAKKDLTPFKKSHLNLSP
jgi:hypothetical protein